MNASDILIKSPQQQRIEARTGKSIADLLQGLRDFGCTQSEIALALDVDTSTVSRWMKQHGIATRRAK